MNIYSLSIDMAINILPRLPDLSDDWRSRHEGGVNKVGDIETYSPNGPFVYKVLRFSSEILIAFMNKRS